MGKIAATSLVKKAAIAVVLAASLAAAAGIAEARPFHRHHGWGGPVVGGLALGLVGAAIASRAYAADDVVCAREARFDNWGNYMGRVRVCRPAY